MTNEQMDEFIRSVEVTLNFLRQERNAGGEEGFLGEVEALRDNCEAFIDKWYMENS